MQIQRYLGWNTFFTSYLKNDSNFFFFFNVRGFNDDIK